MKRITPATVTFVVFAILIGLAAAYGVRHLTKEEAVAAPSPAEQPELATVVVARINLPKYARVLDDYVDVVQVPAEDVPEGALQLESRALFRLTKETILAGQPIHDADLYAVGEVPMLSDRIPPGHRAVTLAVEANSALNGMIQPESLVDVNLTVDSDRPEIGGLATMTLLRRVRVLATSENRFPASEDRPRNLRNVTLAVTPEQANKLTLAQQYGTLSVTLCSSLENLTEEAEEATAEGAASERTDLVNTFDLLGISPLEPQPLPQPPVTRTVEVWRGGSVQEVTFDSRAVQEAENATRVAEGKPPKEIVPVSSEEAIDASDCPECDRKKAKEAQQPSAPEASQPTPAPAVGATGRGYGHVVTVPVEAESAEQ